MCGRYVFSSPQDLAARFQVLQVPLKLAPTYNAAPSQELPVVVEDDNGDRVIRLMRWGLVPRWRKPGQGSTVAPINARAETLLDKPLFRPLVTRKRCLVPGSGFYEWQRSGGRKRPYYIHLRDEPVFAFAGLYDELPDAEDGDGASFTIITTPPNALVAPLHDRMPAILPVDDEDDWLDRALTDPHAAQALLAPFPADRMVADPVSPAVNNVRNNGPELIEAIGATS